MINRDFYTQHNDSLVCGVLLYVIVSDCPKWHGKKISFNDRYMILSCAFWKLRFTGRRFRDGWQATAPAMAAVVGSQRRKELCFRGSHWSALLLLNGCPLAYKNLNSFSIPRNVLILVRTIWSTNTGITSDCDFGPKDVAHYTTADIPTECFQVGRFSPPVH